MRRIGILLILSAVGCGPSSSTPSEPAARATGPAVAPPAPPAPPTASGPRAEQASYVLEATPASAGYASGQAATFDLRLTPRNGWHVNQDYPVEVELSGPSELGLAKARLARADAAEFDEQHFRFSPSMTPTAAGSRTATALVRFAVCTDENCLPQEAAVALPIEVR